MELGYLAADGFATGSFVGYLAPGNTNATPFGDLSTETNTSLLYAAAVGYLPLLDGLSLLGKAGMNKWERRTSVTYERDPTSPPPNTSNRIRVEDDGTGVFLGAGVEYDFANMPLSLRGEYEYARLDSKSSLRLISFSLVLRGW